MAIAIGPIAKPFIWLEGQRIDLVTDVDFQTQDQWQGRVDHAKVEPVTSLNVIGGVTNFNDQAILTFDDRVRITINAQTDNNFNFWTKNNSPTGNLNFEGDPDSDQSLVVGTQLANRYALTYFTINGKDPVRTKAYLYKYKDFSDIDNDDNKDEDGIPLVWDGLGFILGSAQTGSDLITLKAKTFFQGKCSRVAIAKFKIARKSSAAGNDQAIIVENGVPSEQ